MPETQINYDELVQNALRGVVRTLLRDVVEDGLPGTHHFYIAFRTHATGVSIPDYLRKRYPDDMTIVLQHRFWGLAVHDDYFEIGLSFNGKPERLVVPFDAIVGFVDPTVQFALQFHDDLASDGESGGLAAVSDGDGEDKAMLADEAVGDKGKEDDGPSKADTKTEAQDAANGGSDNVVTLDAFRKKT